MEQVNIENFSGSLFPTLSFWVSWKLMRTFNMSRMLCHSPVTLLSPTPFLPIRYFHSTSCWLLSQDSFSLYFLFYFFNYSFIPLFSPLFWHINDLFQSCRFISSTNYIFVDSTPTSVLEEKKSKPIYSPLPCNIPCLDFLCFTLF